MKIPSGVAACLWSYDLSELNLRKHRDLVIFQVLNFGGMKEVRWLLRTYSRRQISEVVKHPRRGRWLPDVLNFWVYILKIRLSKIRFNKALLTVHPTP